LSAYTEADELRDGSGGLDAMTVGSRRALARPGSHAAGRDTISAVVVDPLPLMRLGVAAALTRAKVRVGAEAGRTLEGAALAVDRRADVLVVGEPVVAEIGEAMRFAARHELAILVHVGRVAPREFRELMDLGVRGFLTRNTTAQELGEAVRRVAAGERVMSPSLAWMLYESVTNAAPGPDAAAEPERDRAAEPARDRAALTQREREVLALLATGASNADIASQLSLSLATVRTHLNRVYAKLAVTNRLEAIAAAFSHGLTAV
jgi:DNA-binding NarL/FixJ family response regulator